LAGQAILTKEIAQEIAGGDHAHGAAVVIKAHEASKFDIGEQFKDRL
jgi:hypothetical protein